MKVKRVEKVGFEPITIEFTIESKEELRNLFARLNVLKEHINSDFKDYINDDDNPLYDMVHDIHIENLG